MRGSEGAHTPVKGSSRPSEGKADVASSSKHASTRLVAVGPPKGTLESFKYWTSPVLKSLARMVMPLSRVPLCATLTQMVSEVGRHVSG